MRKLLLFVLFSTCAIAQTSNVQKSTPTQRLTAGFKVPSGLTIQFETGSTLQVDTGAITSFLIDPTTTIGDMIYRNSSNVLDRLPLGASGTVPTSSAGTIAWISPAPLSATYVTLTANSTLTGEFSLGTLASGLLLNTVTGSTGAITRAVPGTDYVAPGATTTSGLTMATARLLGRTTASTGAVEEITVGSGLTLSAGSLSVSGGGSGDVVGPGSATDNALVRFDGTTGKLVQDSNASLADSGTAFVFSGAGGITASGSNQDITLTPSGTGNTRLNGNVGINTSPGSASLFVLKSGTAITTGSSETIVYQNNGTTSSSINVLSIAGASTGTAGYWMGDAASSFQGGILYDNSNDSFAIWANGAQRVGVSSAGAVKFNNYGAGTLTTDASGNVSATSDERLKILRGSFKRGLKEVLALRPISYSWRQESGNETNGVYSGFSAQNVKSVIPEAVGEQPNGFLTLQDRPIIAALVNAVQSLNTKIQTLEDRLARVEEESKKAKQVAR